MYIVSFIMALSLVWLGYFYACRAGKKVSEKKYEKASSSAYVAVMLGVLGVVAFLMPVIL
jgi:hypothetical protein